MITSGLFLLIVAVVLFLARAKIDWGGVCLGMFVAFLLLSTPLGGPLHEAVQAIAGAAQQAGNGLIDAVRGAVQS